MTDLDQMSVEMLESVSRYIRRLRHRSRSVRPQAVKVDNALYLVEAQGDALTASTLLQPSDVTEEMLPEAGYYYDAVDLTDEAESATDTYQLEVPARDRITFK